MDDNAAPLDRICELAEKYDALVMVDECHSAGGFLPPFRPLLILLEAVHFAFVSGGMFLYDL